MHYDIFSDGSAFGNPGPAGAAAIITGNGKRRTLSVGVRWSVIARMEILAAIIGLEALDTPATVVIHTDSRCVEHAITHDLAVWRASGWTNERGAITNVDLWQRLAAAMQPHQVTALWLPAHTGDNDRADRLARRAALSADLGIDLEYEISCDRRATGTTGARNRRRDHETYQQYRALREAPASETPKTVGYEVRRHSGRTHGTTRVLFSTLDERAARARYESERIALRQGGVWLYRVMNPPLKVTAEKVP